MLINCPRGTKDILPEKSFYWQYIEQIIRDICSIYVYQEIRTPIFEHTELFLRTIGETTDIISKEMYTFNDKGNRSITLRPENTAAIVRSFLENKLYNTFKPIKLFYIGPMFRYDKPQAGRYRQFHQFGVEALGISNAVIDSEIIILALHFLGKLGLSNLNLYINSVGCPNCRPKFKQNLQEFLKKRFGELCDNCKIRFSLNSMRILDCKNKKCVKSTLDAPKIAEYLCNNCNQHFTDVQKLLKIADINYVINPRIVRGLDYYTKTTFEIQCAVLGTQNAVCGGGRYDGLVKECGGDSFPGIGFAIGLERIILALEKQKLLPLKNTEIDLYIIPIGENSISIAFFLANRIRTYGLKCDINLLNRSIKSQFKYANKYPARFVAIIGENEIVQKKVMLKNMKTGEQELIDLNNVEKKL